MSPTKKSPPKNRAARRAKQPEEPLAVRKLPAARMLGVSRWHLDKMIANGVIKTVDLHGVTVIPVGEIYRVLAVGLHRAKP